MLRKYESDKFVFRAERLMSPIQRGKTMRTFKRGFINSCIWIVNNNEHYDIPYFILFYYKV